jgi:hypothetical protein
MNQLNKEQKNLAQTPAFPAFPLQNSMGSFITPFPGISRFEHYASLFYANRNCDLKTAMVDAMEFIQKVDEFMLSLNNEQIQLIK